MGITTIIGAHLVDAKDRGVGFEITATIGRLSFCIPREDLGSLWKRSALTDTQLSSLYNSRYADDFIRLVLGAATVMSFDYSDYQNADVIHDINTPIPEEFHEVFDVLIDGGTMEHIFDVKQVLTNYMKMVKTGGNIFVNVPANNLLGHGFYQFSPEFFYRVFSDSNGFSIESISLIESPFTTVEASRRHRCFRVTDPKIAGKRMRVISNKPLMLLIHARKTEKKPLFQSMPMQSDYTSTWEQHKLQQTGASQASTDNSNKIDPTRPFAYLTFWQEIKRYIMQKRKHSVRNKKFFQKYKCIK